MSNPNTIALVIIHSYFSDGGLGLEGDFITLQVIASYIKLGWPQF